MAVSGEVRALDAQGIDPFLYLVVPRVLAVTISVACLTVVFIVASLTSGYLCGVIIGVNPGPPLQFSDSVLRASALTDVLNVVLKTVAPALLTGAICCTEGLSVGHSTTEVPGATARALSRAVSKMSPSNPTACMIRRCGRSTACWGRAT
jgi:phospholipid/cholesterol/gamma-HCH transport system permease protein